MHEVVSLHSSVHLRSPRDEDFPVLACLRRDRSVQHMLLAYPPLLPPSDGAVREWITRRTQEFGGTFLSIAVEHDRIVGFVQIFDVHRRGRFGKLGIALLDDARGHGVASAALKLLLEHARSALDLRKLLLEVRADNTIAIQLYLGAGFGKVGVLRSHYNDGQNRHDVILMERLLDLESDS